MQVAEVFFVAVKETTYILPNFLAFLTNSGVE